MKGQINIIQSLIRGGGVIASLFLTGALISENAAAQTVALCPFHPALGIPSPNDPHDLTFSPLQTDGCEGGFSGSGFIATDPASSRCGACVGTNQRSGGALTIGDCNLNPNWVKYQISPKYFCGPISQCVAAGGTRGNAAGNSPTCANECPTAGEEVFNNNTPDILRDDFCAAPTTCEATHIRTGINSCVPRAAGDCPDNHEFEAAAVGGECNQCPTGATSTGGAACACPGAMPLVINGVCEENREGTCAQTHEYNSGTNMCDPQDAGDCETNEEFVAASANAADGGICLTCPTGATSTGGADCVCASGRRFNQGTLTNRADDVCAEPVACEGGTVSDSNVCECTEQSHRPNDNGVCMAPNVIGDCGEDQRINPQTGQCTDCGTNQTRSDNDNNACACASGHDNIGSLTALNCVPMCVLPTTRSLTNPTMCDCPNTHFETSGGDCVDRIDPSTCGPNEEVIDNECDCPNSHFEEDDGSCVDQIDPNTCPVQSSVNPGTNECECVNRGHRVFNAGTESDPSDDYCDEPETCRDADQRLTGENECVCSNPAHREFDAGTESDPSDDFCAAEETCRSADQRLTETNECVCSEDNHREFNAGTESDPSDDFCARARTCGNGQTLTERNMCECPESSSHRHFDNNTPDMPEDDFCAVPMACPETYFHNERTNACECPYGDQIEVMVNGVNQCACPANEVLNGERCECADNQARGTDGMCPAVAASSGGGGGSSGGGAIALVAVPVVLIGGYWLLGGFGYIEPTYDLAYQGENGNLDWRGDAGFNLRHGGLRSYASAIQSNRDAVSYESGISYEMDNFALTYVAIESQSDYNFDLMTEAWYNLGVMEIAPTVAASLQYRTGEETWNAETTAGVSAAWTAHSWVVRGRSDFAGDSGHALDLELRF